MTDLTLPLPTTRAKTRTALLVVGPLPPPFHGGAVMTDYLLRSGVRDHWHVVHLDTADRRGIDNIGRLDAGNVLLALTHGARFLGLLLWHRPALVYAPIAQNPLAVLRDLLFLVPALLTRRKLIVHLHAGGFADFVECTSPLLRAALRGVLRRAQRVIVLGDGLRAQLEQMVPAERIRVVPNGVPDVYGDVRRYRPHDSFRVLYLGNLIRTKGFLDVLEAVRRLEQDGVNVRLDLAGAWGGTAERAAAAPLLDALGVRVRVHGMVDAEAKRALLGAADVLAFPTYYDNEAHPLVLLEAMAAGLPVITTHHAAIAETVLDEVTGLLVPQQDPAALAAAMQRLIADPLLCERLGSAARARFLERYTLGAWSEQILGVLQDVGS